MAGRFIRGIILSFLPPSASPGRNTSEEEANIDLLLVKLTATYNQEIKRNDRWPPEIASTEFNPALSSSLDERRGTPAVTSIFFIYIYVSPFPLLSPNNYFGKGGNREGRAPPRVAPHKDVE